MKTKAKVFRDPHGNRFIFPMFIYHDDDIIPLETTFWDYSMRLHTATGIEMENDWLEFDDEKFPHFSSDIGSRGFAHGRASAYLFEGPLFDKTMKEIENGD